MTMKRLTGVVLFGCLVGCAATELEEDSHSATLLPRARSVEDAFDATAKALTDRFEALSPEGTSREHGLLLTAWRQHGEPGRLVRSRAKCVIDWVFKGARLSILVQQETSTVKTDHGELDREAPVWTGGAFLVDRELQAEIARAVSTDLAGS